MLSNARNGSGLTAYQAPTANRLTPVFDRLFDDFFAPIAAPAWSGLPLSMWEDENHIYVEMDAPGLTESDIEVSVHAGELIIQGERKFERKQAAYDTRSYGRFEQRLTLSAPVDAEHVEAHLANGVLSVTCPKSEEAKPRKIAVKSRAAAADSSSTESQ